MSRMCVCAVVIGSLLLSGCASVPSSGGGAVERGKTIVIVHGAWGGGWAFRDVDRRLTALGYDVYRPTLTGQGERVHLATKEVGLETHINDVVNTILFEELEDIVLVGHSYGGMVVTGVADRVPERISHLIYLDAMVPKDGEAVMSIRMGEGREPGWLANAEDGFIVPVWVRPDQAPPKDVPHSQKTLTDPISLTHPERMAIRTDYVLTVDPGRTAERDDFYVHMERARAYGWPVHYFTSDHNPQWSHPVELVELLDGIMTGSNQ